MINGGQRGSSAGPSITTAGGLDSERGPLSDARHANASGGTYHSPWESSSKKEPREPRAAPPRTEERKVNKSGFKISPPPRETVREVFRTEQVD